MKKYLEIPKICNDVESQQVTRGFKVFVKIDRVTYCNSKDYENKNSCSTFLLRCVTCAENQVSQRVVTTIHFLC